MLKILNLILSLYYHSKGGFNSALLLCNILWELKADRPGREKLCVGGAEPVRVVLESDGTQVFVYIMIEMRMIDNDNTLSIDLFLFCTQYLIL